ncbi:MAG: hypothetical protein V1767_00835 [Chloroflexota bacterium]
MKCGIDPGIFGAIAFLDDSNNFIKVVDMPVMTIGKSKHQVNAAELAKIIDSCSGEGATAYLESVSAMPGQGVTGVFSFGCSFGIVLGVLGALKIPVVLVTPVSWKRRAGLIGKEKDMARTLAIRLYPEAELSRKKDIGRADAICIARFSVV